MTTGRWQKTVLVAIACAVALFLGFSLGRIDPERKISQDTVLPILGKAERTPTTITREIEIVKRERDDFALRYRKEATRLRQAKNHLASEQKKNEKLQFTLKETRHAVAVHTSGLKPKMARAITRNAASLGTGAVPIFGDAADAASTVVDIAEYCRIQLELDNLNRKVGNPVKGAGRIDQTCQKATDGKLLRWPSVRLPF